MKNENETFFSGNFNMTLKGLSAHFTLHVDCASLEAFTLLCATLKEAVAQAENSSSLEGS